MNAHRKVLFSIAVVGFLVGPAAVSAQEKAARGNSTESATIDAIMEQAVRNIGRRYNLNEAQLEKTRAIMQREVYRFLKEHENHVWPVIRDLLSSQLGAKPPTDPEELQRIGKAAQPLVQLAKDAIYRGNEEWRMYLTPEQKRMHDYDLSEMNKTFEVIERNFDSWSSGEAQDTPLFPPPPPVDASPPRPPKPQSGLPEDPAIEIFDPRRLFDVYVEDFIKKYRLDQGQVDSARSILADFMRKALDFRNTHKLELAKIGADWKAAQESGDRNKLRQAEAERKKLLQPVYELFGQMDQRLMALLTTAQIDRYKAEQRGSDTGSERPTPRTSPSRDSSGSETTQPTERDRERKAPAPKDDAPVPKEQP